MIHMTRYLASAALGAVLTLASGIIGIENANASTRWAPCKTEDSVSCIWDAKHMGNGEGRSFKSGPNGGIKYISHARAHRLLGL